MTVNEIHPAAAPADFDIWDYIDGGAAFIGGTANVVMQLSLRPVGYGVLESPVDSGKVTLHPIHRLRTTLTYLAVAIAGTDEERKRYREAVNGSHRQIRSGPDSPVQYNAFDPKLQQWVAACLYWGYIDVLERMHGPLDADAADAMYAHCIRFGTTLQMRPHQWPADRAAFQQFWDRNLAETVVDPPIRDYFYDLILLRNMPWLVRSWAGPAQRWVVAGLLPEHLRSQLGMTWSARDERRLRRIVATFGAVSRRLPRPLRAFPMNFYLWDMRRRIRKGRPLV